MSLNSALLLKLLTELSGPWMPILALSVLTASALLAWVWVRRLRARQLRMAIGRRRETASGSADLRQAERAADFIDRVTRRGYYLTSLGCGLALTILPVIVPDAVNRATIWLLLTGVTFGSGAFVLLVWRGQSNEIDECLGRRNRAQAGSLASTEVGREWVPAGQQTRREWVQQLEVRLGHGQPTNRAYSCILIELSGAHHDPRRAEAVEMTRSLVGAEISRNLRCSDSVCRDGASRFALALPGCTPADAAAAAERVIANVTSLVLVGVNRRYGTDLHLTAGIAGASRRRRSVSALLRDAERDLERRRRPADDCSSTYPLAGWRTLELAADPLQ